MGNVFRYKFISVLVLSFLWGFNLFAEGQEVVWGPDDNGEFVIDHDIELKASECSKVIVTAEKVRIEPGVVVSFEPDVVVECRVDYCKFYSQRIDGKDQGKLYFKGVSSWGSGVRLLILMTYEKLFRKLFDWKHPLKPDVHEWVVDDCKALSFFSVALLCENIDWSIGSYSDRNSRGCSVCLEGETELILSPEYSKAVIGASHVTMKDPFVLIRKAGAQLTLWGKWVCDESST